MEIPLNGVSKLVALSRRIAQRLLHVGENRLELLVVEFQQERERCVEAILLALAVAAAGLLAIAALTGAIVILTWNHSPAVTLLLLAGLYGIAAAMFFFRLRRLTSRWESFPSTLEELRKDRESMVRTLS